MSKTNSNADQSELRGGELPCGKRAWEATEGMESDVTEAWAVESCWLIMAEPHAVVQGKCSWENQASFHLAATEPIFLLQSQLVLLY